MSELIVYSIIIPHKNTPVLLDRLLDSIPKRNDIQIIVVDDNSDKDKRPIINRDDTVLIQIEEEESGGAGKARNVGLSHVTGKWVLFADADDSYTEKLSFLLDKYSDNDDTDMVILNAIGCREDGSHVPLRQSLYIENYIKKSFYSEKVIRFGMWNPWSRMVKREMIDKYHLQFEVVPFANDMMFCLNCSKFANKISVEPEYVYNYSLPIGRSLTDSNRKKINNLGFYIRHAKSRYLLYSEVHYIFKPSHLHTILFPKIDKQHVNEFRREYLRLLRQNDFSYIKDFYYFFLYLMGRLLNVL